MPKLSLLLNQEPRDAEAISRLLQASGFAETTRVKAKKIVSTARAQSLIDGLHRTDSEREALFDVLDDVIARLSDAADPLRALLNFSRLADVAAPHMSTHARGQGVDDSQSQRDRAAWYRAAWYRALKEQPQLLSRLGQLLSWSQALADTLVRDPALIAALEHSPQPISRAELRVRARAATNESLTSQDATSVSATSVSATSVSATSVSATSVSATSGNQAARLEALRRFRATQTLRIGLLDMERQTWRDEDDFNLVVHQISDLAQVCVEAALEIIANGAATDDFCVLAMGKLGARELNYSSDIDLIFLHDGDAPMMQKLGESLLRALTQASGWGAMYRVDMRLRPDGKSGPLVTSFGYALSYYESFAAAWEWQALIKARSVAGSARLARRFKRFTSGVTWAKRQDDAHLQEMLAMKRRMETERDGHNPDNVKQGPGAIRDAEWIVQQLQMMVGPSHSPARASSTLRALEALRAFGALTHDEERDLRQGYLFLRVLEHRLQLWDERAIRTVPSEEAARASLARRMGFTARASVAARQLDEEHLRHRSDIRALCERLFWGWRDEDSASNGESPPMSTHAAASDAQLIDRQSSIVDRPSEARLKRIVEGTPTQPLPAPLSRQIARALPLALRHVEHASEPERALLNLERLCDASGNRLSLLRSLADAPRLARAVFAILGGSQWLSDTLVRFPQLLDVAAHRSLLERPRSWEEARASCRDAVLPFRDRRAALRRWKAREMLRIGLRDLVLDAPSFEITREIADLAQACIALANEEIDIARRPNSEQVAFCVLGMGKLGGGEMHYSSDADVIFSADYSLFAPPMSIHAGAHAQEDALQNDATRDDAMRDDSIESGAANREATGRAEDLMRYLGERTADGTVFEVDARLRPDGRSGPLVRSVEGFVEYFEREQNGIAVWERQALTRARFVAGDAQTAARLMASIRHVAFPARWQDGWSDELRHIKSRVENERASKGARSGAVYDVKLGPGALSDIEWTAQWIALKNGARFPNLRTPNTLRQIQSAREVELLSQRDANVLRDAYIFLRRAELRLQITQEQAARAPAQGSREWISWARSLFPDELETTAMARFEEQWDMSTHAARQVMEQVRDAL